MGRHLPFFFGPEGLVMVAQETSDDRLFSIEAKELKTERLVLRPPVQADIAQLAALADNLRVAEMLARVPHPYTPDHARSFIEFATGTTGAIYALTLAEPGQRPGSGATSGQLVGVAGLEPRDHGLELGYWIGEPYWNKGYATEAAHALVDHAFRSTTANALHAACRVINPASRRVIHKCGFQYAGQGMLNSLVAGKVPIERYRLDRRTWASLKAWRSV